MKRICELKRFLCDHFTPFYLKKKKFNSKDEWILKGLIFMFIFLSLPLAPILTTCGWNSTYFFSFSLIQLCSIQRPGFKNRVNITTKTLMASQNLQIVVIFKALMYNIYNYKKFLKFFYIASKEKFMDLVLRCVW